MVTKMTPTQLARLGSKAKTALRASQDVQDTNAQKAIRKASRRVRVDYGALFETQIVTDGLVGLRYQREHLFARSVTFTGKDGRDRERAWRFDFAWPTVKVAVEIEGLVVHWQPDGTQRVSGRHVTPKGMSEDSRKYATAAMLGWYVLRFPQAMIKSGEASSLTKLVLQARMKNQ
jgi:very-short-patch-repair endonuclease